MPGLVGPESYPIRDVKDPKMKNGRTVNPPRFLVMGGFSGQGKWPSGSDFPVEKPTAIKGAKAANRGND